LVYVIEEEPLPEATSMGALVVGQFLELFPGQAEGCREGLQDLQDVASSGGRSSAVACCASWASSASLASSAVR